MIKALTAGAVAAFISAATTILPSFAPPVEADVVRPLAKADRLPVGPPRLACAEQNWPKIDPSCLRGSDPKSPIVTVRVVTTDRR